MKMVGSHPKGGADFFMMGQDLLRSLKPEILGNFQMFNIILILILIV